MADCQQRGARDEIHGYPEPVCDGGPVRLWDEVGPQGADGGEVKADGRLQGEEGEEARRAGNACKRSAGIRSYIAPVLLSQKQLKKSGTTLFPFLRPKIFVRMIKNIL